MLLTGCRAARLMGERQGRQVGPGPSPGQLNVHRGGWTTRLTTRNGFIYRNFWCISCYFDPCGLFMAFYSRFLSIITPKTHQTKKINQSHALWYGKLFRSLMWRFVHVTHTLLMENKLKNAFDGFHR